jgi:hypothetical protein
VQGEGLDSELQLYISPVNWKPDNPPVPMSSPASFSGDLFKALGYEVPDSQTNFVLARQAGVDQRPVLEALKQRRILVRYFDTGLRDALRISVGTDAEIDALVNALEEISVSR